MIRFIHCIKAKPGLSIPEFRRHVRSKKFTSLVEQLALHSSAADYKVSVVLDVPANQQLVEERGGTEPCHALLELRWESGGDLMDLQSSPTYADLIAEMNEYQQGFVDFPSSSRFFVED